MNLTFDGAGSAFDAFVSAMLSLAFVLVFILVIGWVAGRVLGVKRGFWRAFVAGLVGLGTGLLITDIQFGSAAEFNDLGDVAKLGFGFLGYVLLMTMLTSIVLEVLLRPRDRRRRGLRIPHPMRRVRAWLSVVGRLREISRAARRTGLASTRFRTPSSLFTPEGAEALRGTLEQSGGMLVKFGQIASTREDMLPEVVTTQLATLRTAVAPLPYDVVAAVITDELGPRAPAVLAGLDRQSLAAASIGVTHRGTLPDGRDVIVKIQRPGIDDVVARDARVLRLASRQLERRSESAARLGVAALADELVDGVREELDFTREAANNAAMRRTRSGDTGIRFPTVHLEWTRRRVLVMDRVAGVPVSDRAAVDASGVPRQVLAGNLFRSFLAQVLVDGVYHADPHPGNVLIDPEGVLWFIDYGAVGHIDPVTLESLQQMAAGFMVRDPSALARAVRRMAGAAGEGLDMAALEFDLGLVLTEVGGGGFDPEALQQVVAVLGRHGIPAPRTLTVLGRAALTLEGTLRTLDPDFRMAARAPEELRGIVGSADLNPRAMLMKEAVRSMPSLRALPQLTEDLALQARAGRLTLRVDRFAGSDGERVGRWLDEVLFSALAIGGLVGSALLLLAAGVTGSEDVALYLRVIGFTGLVVSTAMQMRTVARILNRRGPDEGA